ncbi:MAG: polysaccharide deacetylase family protein [Proteobacteria bacterium]|nr:polysaccharide deacetylase family protein [Pseudomonadota bacterium]
MISKLAIILSLSIPAVSFAEKKVPTKAPDAAPKDDVVALTNDPIVGKADRIDGDEAKNVVAFTFDDGPNPSTTPAVIDALQKYDIPATFFIVTQRITGKSGERSRELLQRELAAGFGIGSHSVTHPNLRAANARTLEKEIDGSIRTLAGQIGKPVGVFRAPYGALGPAGRARLKKLGLTEAFWSVDTLDWQAKNSERLRKKVRTMIVKQDGGVVLMHDVKPITAKIIADVFDDLEVENCARLAAKDPKKEPIIPVSIHYFLKDGKTARAIPEDVKKRTEAYKLALPGRCAKRPSPPVAPPTSPAPTPTPPTPAPPTPAESPRK